STPIIKAIEIIDAGALQNALVVDGENRMLGTLTDGDVRRGILKGVTLESPVRRIMNSNPTVARDQDDGDTLISIMKST
ncbi:MAG: CBS domain-containing protein, partial [Desulfotomaculales bacterium]